MDWVQRMAQAYFNGRRRPAKERLDELLEERRRREEARPVEDPLLKDIKSGAFVASFLLSKNWHGGRLYGHLDFDLAPVMRFTSDNFQATVRCAGPIGQPVDFPGDRHMSEFIPEAAGEYYLLDGEVRAAGDWPGRGGKLRQLLCRAHLHLMTVVGTSLFKTKQCPHCLKVKMGWVPGFGPQEFWDQVEMSQRFVMAYDRKFPLPGNGWQSFDLAGNISPDRRSISFEL